MNDSPRKIGRPTLPMATRIHRWMTQHVTPVGDCWEWTGVRDRNGYGHVRVDGRTTGIHRAFYTFFFGSIPDGYELDHLCRKRNCVNPFHLEMVTHKTNMERAVNPGQYDRSKRGIQDDQTHCSKRHRLTEANTYRGESGLRSCLDCKKANALAYQRAKAAKASQAPDRTEDGA